MIDARHEPIKDQQPQDQQGIGRELFGTQQLGDKEVDIQVIERDNDRIVHQKIGREIMLGKNIELVVARTGSEDQGQQQETSPCRNMNDDLYSNLFHRYQN